MNDYYSILRVSPSASAEEIKRAFRRLAVQYHPDKNPAPVAEALFKEINEAYDVLGDPEKKSTYDMRRSNPFLDFRKEQPTPQHRDPAYHTRRPFVKHKGENERLRELMEEYQPIVHRISVFCFLVSMFLLIDYILPSRMHDERIVRTGTRETYSRNYSITWWVIVTDVGREVTLPYELSDFFQVGETVHVQSSFILNVNREVEGNSHTVFIRRSIYGNFIFAPVVLLIISFFAVRNRKDIERSFNLGIVVILIFLLTAIIILLL